MGCSSTTARGSRAHRVLGHFHMKGGVIVASLKFPVCKTAKDLARHCMWVHWCGFFENVINIAIFYCMITFMQRYSLAEISYLPSDGSKRTGCNVLHVVCTGSESSDSLNTVQWC